MNDALTIDYFLDGREYPVTVTLHGVAKTTIKMDLRAASSLAMKLQDVIGRITLEKNA